ncbi:MAG: AEC family transporter [Kiritimatiellaeota bacterium]|nr:AEC family transporter [Kiritimatiellota bacterium]
MLILLLKMLPLILLSLAGYVLCRMKWLDAAFNRQLSLVMLNVFYPCLIVSKLLDNFTWETLLQNWVMPAGTILILVTGWVIGFLTLPLLKRHPESTRRCYHFVSMMNNYSFLPILMATSLWGEKAVALIVLSALGSELCVWTLGVKSITGQKFGRGFFRQIMSLPMIALLTSFALLAIRTRYVPADETLTDEFFKNILTTCRMAGAATIPASALICGVRIAMIQPQRLFSPLILGTSLLRLVVTPAVCIAFLLLLPLGMETRRVLILIATMPVAMVSVTLAEAYKSDADFSASTIFLTHLLCLITIPLWLAFVSGR